jgi:hypothetical protein
MERNMKIPQKTQNRTTIKYSKNTLSSGYDRPTCTLICTAAQFTTAKLWKQDK